jgi:hypothetical protein
LKRRKQWQEDIIWSIHNATNTAQHEKDFGLYNADRIDMVSLCALMLTKYHIPPSVTLAQHPQWLADTLTLIGIWDKELDKGD